eukprot:3969213-Karenia_brevis.AAC.1
MVGSALILGVTLGIQLQRTGLRQNKDGAVAVGKIGMLGKAVAKMSGLKVLLALALPMLLWVLSKKGLLMAFRVHSWNFQTHLFHPDQLNMTQS